MGLSRWNFSPGKRAFDATTAAVVLTLSLPLMALIAIAIRVSAPGPVLFRQRRVGKNGSLFEILKFRTMVHRSMLNKGTSITRKGDSRVTGLGRWLRRSKLDELPQLYNVLRGDMSLVGPRPDLPEFYENLGAEKRQILALQPGVTGWATLQFRDEEGHLPFLQGVHHLAVVPADLEDALTIGHELDLGQMPVEPRALVQERPRSPDTLQRHTTVEQRLHDAKRDEIAERVQTRNTGPAAGALHRRRYQSDLVPITELPGGTRGELACLMSGEPLHADARPPFRSTQLHALRAPPCSERKSIIRSLRSRAPGEGECRCTPRVRVVASVELAGCLRAVLHARGCVTIAGTAPRSCRASLTG